MCWFENKIKTNLEFHFEDQRKDKEPIRHQMSLKKTRFAEAYSTRGSLSKPVNYRRICHVQPSTLLVLKVQSNLERKDYRTYSERKTN